MTDAIKVIIDPVKIFPGGLFIFSVFVFFKTVFFGFGADAFGKTNIFTKF